MIRRLLIIVVEILLVPTTGAPPSLPALPKKCSEPLSVVLTASYSGSAQAISALANALFPHECVVEVKSASDFVRGWQAPANRRGVELLSEPDGILELLSRTLNASASVLNSSAATLLIVNLVREPVHSALATFRERGNTAAALSTPSGQKMFERTVELEGIGRERVEYLVREVKRLSRARRRLGFNRDGSDAIGLGKKLSTPPPPPPPVRVLALRHCDVACGRLGAILTSNFIGSLGTRTHGTSSPALMAFAIESSSASCLSSGHHSLNLASLFPRALLSAHPKWHHLLNTSEECPGATAMAQGGPGASITVAVLAVGEYRIFDGTWPSLFRSIMEPMRSDSGTRRVDLFLCVDKDWLPAHMPAPTATFVDVKSTNQFSRYDSCFNSVAAWASSPRNFQQPQLEWEDYDFYLRTRPDLEFAYSLAWPIVCGTSKGDPFFADAYAPMNALGNIAAYPWAHLVTVNMIKSNGELAANNGRCPTPNETRSKLHTRLVELHRYNDPCFDVSDHISLLRGHKAAEAYFSPLGGGDGASGSDVHGKDLKPQLHSSFVKEVKCSKLWDNWVNEAITTHRLRHAGMVIAPMDFGGFVVVGSRKKRLKGDCHLKSDGNLSSCLTNGDDRVELRNALSRKNRDRDIKVLCIPGAPAALPPGFTRHPSMLPTESPLPTSELQFEQVQGEEAREGEEIGEFSFEDDFGYIFTAAK